MTPPEETRPRRIVIGETSPMVGKILRDKLVREGHEVTWLADPAEIEAAVGEAPPDLLILNAMLPEGDGIRILESLRQPGGDLRCPVFLTFERALYPEEEERLRALDPTALIPLPFKPTEVARQARRLFG